MHILMIFLDGIGLGDDNPAINPFAAVHAPTLEYLAGGQRWLRSTGYQVSERAVFIPTDPCLGVPGRPQSASGQAAILTGLNVPLLIGEHYGPKPNAPIRELLAQDNFYKQVVAHGKTAALLEAYPPQFHRGVDSGKRLRSSYQMALHEAGLPLFGIEHLQRREALTVDWTGSAWVEQPGFPEVPVYTPEEAGRQMVELSRRYDFAFFSHWLTDVIGHRGPVEEGVKLLELFDGVMRGVLATWEDDEGLVIITSDHGNLEDVSDRKHTMNEIPTVLIGNAKNEFAKGFSDLTGYVPRMANLLFG